MLKKSGPNRQDVPVLSFWLAALRGQPVRVHANGRYDRYTVYFTDPISGVYNEAVVKYKGVDVGKVVALRLTPDRSDLIKVDIEVKDSTPIRAGTTAKVEMQGVTGQSYIELSTERADDKPPLQVADETYPVLKGSGSQLAKFIDDLPKVSKDLQTALSAIDQFSRGSLKMVESIRGLADKLKDDPSQIIRGPSRKGVEIPK